MRTRCNVFMDFQENVGKLCVIWLSKVKKAACFQILT